MLEQQEEEERKKEIEREKIQMELLKKQLAEGKIKREIEEPTKQLEDTNFKGTMPAYYITGIVPQELKPEVKEAQQIFLAKLLNPFTPIDELRDMFMSPLPPNVGQI